MNGSSFNYANHNDNWLKETGLSKHNNYDISPVSRYDPEFRNEARKEGNYYNPNSDNDIKYYTKQSNKRKQDFLKKVRGE